MNDTGVSWAGVMGRRLPVAVILGGVLLGWCGGARAQNLGGRVMQPQVQQPETAKTEKVAPPPALPGSKPGGDTVIPAERQASDMEPNEALFDAINRGDLAAAKDALNRGADIGAHNILGLSPLELAIDLGHNDLAFLLLSMRGDSATGSKASPAAKVAAKAPTPSPTSTQPGRRPALAPAAAARPAGAPERPQLYAGNGGMPVPQAGFLGFNAGRTP